MNKGRSNLIRSILGSGLVQLAGFITSVVIARNFSLSQVGEYASYVAFSGILVIVSTLRFDFAINNPKIKKNAVEIGVLATWVNLSVVIIIALILCALGFLGINFGFRVGYVVLLPITIFLGGITNIYTAILIREERYNLISGIKIFTSVISIGSIFILLESEYGDYGLLWSLIFSASVGVMALALFSRINIFETKSVIKLMAIMIANKKFPIYDLPSTILGVLGSQGTILAFGMFYSLDDLGAFSYSDRIGQAFVAVVGWVVGSTFRNQATKLKRANRIYEGEYLRALYFLVITGAIIFIPLAFYGVEFMALVFGERWMLAGKILEVMAPMYYLRYVASPLSMSFYVSNKLKEDLFGQIFLCLSSFGVIFFGYLSYTFEVTILALSFFNGFIYSIYIFRGWILSRKKT